MRTKKRGSLLEAAKKKVHGGRSPDQRFVDAAFVFEDERVDQDVVDHERDLIDRQILAEESLLLSDLQEASAVRRTLHADVIEAIDPHRERVLEVVDQELA